ncbi:MAG: DegT/DnrJ/EryC1/StrS family aminotransferase [Escherichia coli]|nr:DegT/DnrJ/EryC1/StrS family aminotransferase [Escherichia coli]
MYYKNLKHTDLILPKIIDSVISGFNMFVIQSENRDELVEKLRENGISTGVYYPVPMHLQKVYKNLGYKKGDMPNAEYLSPDRHPVHRD